MIKENEIKVGNTFYFPFHKQNVSIIGYAKIEKDDSFKVQFETNGGILLEPLSVLKPITLTEELLLKYGFEKVKNIRGSYELKGLRIHSQYPPPHKEELFNGVTEVYYYEHPIWCFDACKYLHKLQNLYFFLTGKELSVVANGS